MERTLALIKPDGVLRGMTGQILSRLENVGLKIVGIKILIPSEEKVSRHYPDEWFESVGKKNIEYYKSKGLPITETPLEAGMRIKQKLIRYFTSGPVIPIVLEGDFAVQILRKLAGPTDPLSAPPGTIRGDFSLDSYNIADGQDRAIKNLIHASGSVEEAKREIAIWFDETELCSYQSFFEEILLKGE